MVDPQNVTNYQRSDAELEEFLIFCVAVAGKTAMITAPKVHEFCENIQNRVGYLMPQREAPPLACIVFALRRDYENLIWEEMTKVKLGKYQTMMKMFRYLETVYDTLNLRKVTVAELEQVPGIGMKTSRFFVLHTNPAAPPMAVLDTHILKFLRESYNILDVGLKSTPTSRRAYLNYERTFIDTFKWYKDNGFRGTLADFDLMIWVYYNNKMDGGIYAFLTNSYPDAFVGPLESTQKGTYDIRS